ncbi:MAG: hypothetical protein ACRD2N_08360 [Vicinamibacterales bacterium]
MPKGPVGALLALLALPILSAGQVAQNPSPMSDTTRPHPRLAEGRAPGKRLTLPLGELFLSDRFQVRDQAPLLVHFHGAAWLIEQHVAKSAPSAALLTINLGAGSSRYAAPFSDPARFRMLLDEAATGVGMITGRRPVWSSITLTSFSAGYGAVRAILQVSDNFALVDNLLLADSLHSSYLIEGDVAAPRAADLPLDAEGIGAFVSFAADAVANRKRCWITHSEVYPGTYASTTETANAVLSSLKLERRPVLQHGPIGMQQLSTARAGSFTLAGFAGNSAPDHLDHLYAIGDWLREWNVVR